MKVVQIIFIIMLFGFLTCSSFAQEHLAFSTFHTSVRGLIFKDILTEAYQKIGISVTVTPYPARRGLEHANIGKLDGEAGRLEHISSQYPNLIMIPVPIFLNKMVAFTKNTEIQITDWADMRPYNITSMIGLKYTESKLEGFEHVELVTTIQQAFKKLDVGRADIVVFSLFDGVNIINKLSLQGVRPITFEQIPSYHFLHNKHSKIVPAITVVLRSMEREGRLKEIISEYMEKLEEGKAFEVPQN